MSTLGEKTARGKMSSPLCLLSEKHLLCFLCRDVFTNPVTTPCGHSFCQPCISHYWSRHQYKYCPDCRKVFSDKPDLSVNRILADVSETYRKARPQKAAEEEPVVDVQEMIQERLNKIERLKNALDLQKSSYLREVRESQKVFSVLVSAMEKTHKAVVSAIEERQREEEKKVEALMIEIKGEIEQLRNQTSNSDVPDQSDDIKQAVIPPEMKDWSKVTIETDPCLGVTRRALMDILVKIKQEEERLSKAELKRIEKYSVDVNLSAKTAHPVLFVSEDRKQVRHTDKLQEVSDTPKRFDRVANVLAKESLSSGRCYWEVEVGDKIEWTVGIARQSINRKGKFTVCPANGFWTLSLKAGGQYFANTSPVTLLGLDHRPRGLGVFLDYPEGRVSFYCTETGAHLHTFMDRFTDRLHPFFNPGRLHGGKNGAPLIISSNYCSI